MPVEKADCQDIGSLVKLRLAYLQEDHGQLSKEQFQQIEALLPEYFTRHLNDDLFVYIIREGTEIVSCAFLFVTEKPMSPSFINGKTGSVLNVYTCPEHRKRGYGGKIMEELIRDARTMCLSVIELKSTDAGYTLYQKSGFSDDQYKYHLMKWRNPDLTD